jgi:hypothetical protein
MTAPDALLREALEQALDRMQTAFDRITPNGGDEFHTPEGVAQSLWFGMEEVRAALSATPPASAQRDALANHIPSAYQDQSGYDHVTCTCGWEDDDNPRVGWVEHIRAAEARDE